MPGLLPALTRDWWWLVVRRSSRDQRGVSEYHLEYLQINQLIDLALLGVLWETQEISEFGMENEPGYGEIEVQFSGLARSYIDSRQYLRNQAAKAKQQTAS